MEEAKTIGQPVACHVMAKPTGSICNISCQYCFYLEKEKLYPEAGKQWQMLNWFYMQTPYWDDRKDVYPVGKIYSRDVLRTHLP